jgi:hypothetical protein
MIMNRKKKQQQQKEEIIEIQSRETPNNISTKTKQEE